jgi:hypothetical protein
MNARRDDIFISYRREDSQAWVDRLYRDLRDRFGAERVYRDTDSNRPAQDWLSRVFEALDQSRVVLVVIGPRWVDARLADWSRRLDNPADLVRQEIERALSTGKVVLPLLVGSATVPDRYDLPVSLQPLTWKEALRLSDDNWDHDYSRLLGFLDDQGVTLSAADEADETDEWVVDEMELDLTRSPFERTFAASRHDGHGTGRPPGT